MDNSDRSTDGSDNSLVLCTACGAVQFQPVGRDRMARVRGPLDTVSRFVAERCEVGDGVRTDTREVVAAYREWAGSDGADALSNRAFGDALREVVPVAVHRSGGQRYYWGLALR